MKGSNTKCGLNYIQDSIISEYDNLKEKVESINTTYNDGYRYSGKEPNNWIWFNNEMWRIIGSVPVCTSATMASNGYTGTCSQAEADKPRLVKIIRSESLGGFAYHSAYSNALWGSGNTLYDLLNNYYYGEDGKRDATGASPCLGYSADVYTLCNYNQIGISSAANDYYGKMIEEVHMNGGTLSYSSKIDAAYDLEIATVTKKTKIGLMTSSDYGYATDVAAKDTSYKYSTIGLSALSNFEEYNWLFGQYHERTMTPYSTADLIGVYYNGQVYNTGSVNTGYAIRPVLYLDANAYIVGGTGTITDPYIIGM